MLARLKQELKSELCWRKVRQWGRQWGWAARGLGGTRLPHSAPAAPPHPAAPQPASSLLALPSACSTAASPVTAAPSRTRCCARTACRRSCTKTGGGCWRWEVRAPRQAWGTNCLLAFPLPVSLPIVIFHAPAWLLSPRPLPPTVPPHCAPPLCPPTVPPHCAPPLCPPTVPPHCAPPLCPPTVPPHCAPPLCPPTVPPPGCRAVPAVGRRGVAGRLA